MHVCYFFVLDGGFPKETHDPVEHDTGLSGKLLLYGVDRIGLQQRGSCGVDDKVLLCLDWCRVTGVESDVGDGEGVERYESGKLFAQQ